MDIKLTPGEIEFVHQLQDKLVDMFNPRKFSNEHLYLVGAIRVAFEKGKAAGYNQHIDEMWNTIREQQASVLKSLVDIGEEV